METVFPTHRFTSSSFLCRNEPVQPHGSSQPPDVTGTDGRSSCIAHESPAANEPELRPCGEEETGEGLL